MVEQINKKITPISKRDFENRRYKKFPHFGHAARDNVMPLVLIEVNAAMMDIPLVFLREDEGYRLYGVSSFINNFNVLLDSNGLFRTTYIPACYRAYPFLFANATSGEKVLCFNEDSGLLTDSNDSQGLPFFDEQGNVSQNIQEIMLLIKTIADNANITQDVLRVLDSLELIAPWDLNITLDGQRHNIGGFYTINDEKFLRLDGSELKRLRDSGALSLIYAQVFSRQHVKQIEQLCSWFLTTEKTKQQNLVDHKGDLNIEFLNQNQTIPI